MLIVQINYLEDVPFTGEFGFNTDSWMKSDTTQKYEVLIKHLLTNFFDFLYRTVTDRNKDDANNYMYTSSTEVISMGLFQFYYKNAVKEGDGKKKWRFAERKYLLPHLKDSDKT